MPSIEIPGGGGGVELERQNILRLEAFCVCLGSSEAYGVCLGASEAYGVLLDSSEAYGVRPGMSEAYCVCLCLGSSEATASPNLIFFAVLRIRIGPDPHHLPEPC